MADLGVSVGDLASAFRVPRDWILLERTALLLVGLCTALAPDVNPLRVLRPHIEPLVGSAGAVAGAAVQAQLERTVRLLLGLPARLDRVLSQVEAGTLTVRDAGAERLAAAVRQLAWTVGAVGAGGVGWAAWAGGAVALGGALAVASGLCALAALGAARR